LGIILLELILFGLLWSSARGGVQGKHEMAESRGGQVRTWSQGKGGQRMVSRGTTQRVMAGPALGGDGENGRWDDWVGRELGLAGCAG
jgi:hypothetical protein